MFSFRLFGFRVSVQPWFWITGLLLGYGLATGPDGHPLRLALWLAIVFLSILWHELGHAFAFRRCGVQSEIVLHALGGYAMPVQGHGLTRRQDVMVSAAGPAFQLLIGAPLWWMNRQGMFYDFTLERPFAWDVIWMLMWVNLTWALVNLLPVFPLDGGRICHALCGPRKERTALWVSLICATATSATLLSMKMVFSGAFFALLAWNNWQRLNGRGEANWC
jgi:stage IV sporulation protein FB